MQLEQILQRRRDLWRGNAITAAVPAGEPTGFAALDALLPWRGWPPGVLIEIVCPQAVGALSLIFPALVSLSREPRWLLLVDPPLLPYAPVLAASGMVLTRVLVAETGGASAWTAEQGLRSGACGAVLLWGGRWRTAELRRLQLAAETGDARAILFRGPEAVRDHSPAVLRLQADPSPGGLAVTLLKQRGGRAGARLELGSLRPNLSLENLTHLQRTFGLKDPGTPGRSTRPMGDDG